MIADSKKWKRALRYATFRSMDLLVRNRLENRQVQDAETVVWVPAREIRHRIIGYPLRMRRPLGQHESIIGATRAGFWDRSVDSIESGIWYRGLVQRFVEGREWEETCYFQDVKRSFDRGRKRRLDTSAVGFLNRKMKAWDRIYASMRDHGYKTHAELSQTIKHASRGSNTIPGEVEIAVGHDGRLIMYEGRHRLAMAKILNLDRIPVVVRVWHDKFVARFDKVCPESRTAYNLMKFREDGGRDIRDEQ